MDLAEGVLQGNRLALARCLTQVENSTSLGREALEKLFPHTGHAHLIGVTGAPGTGKSSLVNALARFYRQPGDRDSAVRERPLRVAIVAVDPTSPFTGGAILGDRVRMRDLTGDPDVFIRSMATRGSLGGLANATTGVVHVMDAAGFDLVLIETVGAGQAEVDIARLAHTTLVVEAPGLGDDIQAIKAGILEIADILVINKSDAPGADAAERSLRAMLQLAHPVAHVFQHHGQKEVVLADHLQDQTKPLWIPPIQRTVATDGQGIDGLAGAIDRHYQFLHDTGEWEKREQDRLESEFEALLQETLLDRLRMKVSQERYKEILARLVERSVSPWQAVDSLMDGVLK